MKQHIEFADRVKKIKRMDLPFSPLYIYHIHNRRLPFFYKPLLNMLKLKTQ